MATTQKAIVIQGPKDAQLVTDRPLPKLRDDYILVKTVAVALNPTDWKHIEYIVQEAGPLVGCDYAGIVEEVGPKVTKHFQKGDRIAGIAHGSNTTQHEDGAFAEHIVVKGDLQIKIPDNISFEEAATLGVGITTVGQGLYQTLGLAWPTTPIKDDTPVLIYGGSTATGILGIQFAKLSGYKVIVTCSPRNFDLVKSFGADEVFDYNDPEASKKIRESTNDNLQYAWDTISAPSSAQFCADALSSSSGGQYACLSQVAFPRSDVKASMTLGYTGIGEAFSKFGRTFEAIPENYEFCKKFWKLAEELIAAGKIRTHKISVRDGLEGVLEGLNELKENKVSGEKLVYRL
ncbi:chaperonin 10-like protein [Mariannaea sp. PMI_226]|nr:chaperonin 10-like protein [Mariannaea sp. PMI_226]